MKNIKLNLFLLLSGVFAVSCNDAVDITQPGELYPETTFQNIQDLQTGLYGVYASVPAEGGIYFTSVFTDETAFGRSNGGQGVNYLQHILNAQTSPSGIWSGNYRAINLANRIIAAADGVTVEEGEEEAFEHIVAQAYAIRAFCHLQLMTYYAADMKDNSSLGVIKMDFIPSITDFLPRNTVGEVFELISSDLDYAEANLSATEANRGHFTKNAITALKARMAAYRGNYTQAATYASTVISSPVSLASPTVYKNMFIDLEDGEILFKLIRNAANVSGANFYQVWSSVNASPTGSPFLEVNRALFNLVDIPTDVRRGVITYAAVDVTGAQVEIHPDYTSLSLADYISQDVLPVYKYPRSKGVHLLGDIKVIRLSEMYLIRAESKVATDLAGAAADVHAVRVARNPAAAMPVYANQQEAWADILKERRVELAFEGHRYIDMKRLGNLAGVQIDRDPRDSAEQGFPQTLANSDHKYTLPIPISEMNVNPNIQQNLGYTE
jgi:hypothetical protein